MSIAPPTMEQAKAAKRKLLNKVRAYDEYISALAKISSNGNSRLIEAEDESPSSGSEPVKASESGAEIDGNARPQATSTAAVAYRVLSDASKSMRIGDIVRAMRATGWEGSGEDKKDEDRVYAAMYRAKKKFVRPRRAHWTVRKQEKAS